MKVGSSLALCIPARFNSKRFPGKLLKMIEGKTLIQHVVERALKSVNRDQLFVLAGDTRIEGEAKRLGVQCLLTRSDLLNGTERVASVLQDLNFDYFVNVQADDPTIPSELISSTIEKIKHSNFEVVTPIYEIRKKNHLSKSSIVKVAVNRGKNRALYFSRFPIPMNYRDEITTTKHYGHIGIYGYSRSALENYARSNPTPGEISESLEQLRFLENDISIGVFNYDYEPNAIDLPDDYERIQAMRE